MRTALGALCFILMISELNTLNLFQVDANNYGPYDVNWTQYRLCKGPKSRNDTILYVNITKDGAFSIGYYNFTFLLDTKYEEIKIMVYSLTAKGKKLLWTYKIIDPCKHFSIASTIQTFFKSNTCVIKKGSYCVSINLNEITSAFFGSSFFYGEYFLKITGTSKQGNIICLSFVVNFTKKIEAKVNERNKN